MTDPVEELVRLSKFAGERFDLVQAGGGNTSVKTGDGQMLIKASGYALSEVEAGQGHVLLDNRKVLAVFDEPRLVDAKDRTARDRLVNALLADAVKSGGRPSIETFIHSVLGRCTLHTHPVSVSAAVCMADWRAVLSGLFTVAAFVDYRTPGIELGIELKKVVDAYKDKHGGSPAVVFLGNHGLITSADTVDEAIRLTEAVSKALEGHLGLDLSEFKTVSRVSKLVNSLDGGTRTAYLSCDRHIKKALLEKRGLFFLPPFCPDMKVYCGSGVIELKDLENPGPLTDYMAEHRESPRVIVHDDNVFFLAKNVRKAKEMEDVLKYHVLVNEAARGKAACLSREEIDFIGGWEAEIYRQSFE